MLGVQDNEFGVLRAILTDVLEDFDLDDMEITRETRLIELGVESISLVYLVSELQQHYGLEDAVFRKLREEGKLLTEMNAGDVVDAVVAVRAASGA